MPCVMARWAAASSRGEVFPAPVAATTTPRAPAATAASISAPSVPMPACDELDAGPRLTARAGGGAAARAPGLDVAAPSTDRARASHGSASWNVSNAVVCILVTSSAASIVPASATTTPASRSVRRGGGGHGVDAGCAGPS